MQLFEVFASRGFPRHSEFMSVRLKFWGVRGSIPSAPLPHQWTRDFEELMRGFFRAGFHRSEQISDYLKTLPVPVVGGYGTSTTCVEFKAGSQSILLDGGSGIRQFSDTEMTGPAAHGKAEYHIFMTHFHWDHLIGLPFFAPHFIKGNIINYYAVQPELEEMIRGKFRKPYFPVPFDALSADIRFHQLEPRKALKVGEISLTPYRLDHPDPCWGYRVEAGSKAYSHCVDTEGTRSTAEELGPDLPLYRDADLMYFDAQYTLPELADKANWGHSASQIGLDIAFRENIKRVLFAHHDPGATTSQIQQLERQTQAYCDWRKKVAADHGLRLPSVDWAFAYEGLEIEL